MSRNDIMILRLQSEGAETPYVFLGTPADEFGAAFSPDGQWLAYTSDGSGTPQVYVRPFPGPGPPWPVSLDGGTLPVWSRGGNEILYRALDGRIMAATWAVHDGRFETRRPSAWTSGRPVDLGQVRAFDAHPDGRRLAAVIEAPESKQHRLVLLRIRP